MNGKRILLVEDSKEVQTFNRDLLEIEGFAVETAMTLAEAREILGCKPMDAIILDIGMPDGNGLDFLREFRKTSHIPVLLLTGFGEAKDIVKGFKSGCDDYLPKPYTFEILLVRLQRLLKNMERVPETVTKGALTLNILSHEAYLDGVDLQLAPKDFTLLQYFVYNDGLSLKTGDIYEKVWAQPMCGNPQALNRAVSRLRKKIAGCGYAIVNVYGNGYRFEKVQ